MTDKTDKKTGTENKVHVETKTQSELDTAVEPMLDEKTSAAKGDSDTNASASTEPKVSPPPSKTSDKVASSSGGGAAKGNTMKSTPVSNGGTKKSKSATGTAVLTAIVVIAVAGATIWYLQQQNQRYSSDLEQQLQANIRASNHANGQAQEALSLIHAQQQKLTVLEQRLASIQEQAADLNQALQTLTDAGTEVILLNDIDHLVTIAQQQLSLGGNVANAIVSLETAQARLARANRPTLASLQQTINGDLDRLRAASTTDIASLSRQLELLSEQLNNAPLLMPDDTQLTPTTLVGANELIHESSTPSSILHQDDQVKESAWWERSLLTAKRLFDRGVNAIRHDLGEFISIRRVDDASALLMTPEQANRFRDNLRLRVSSAKLALMTNQPAVWKTETAAIVQAIEQRFDLRSSASMVALQSATALNQVNIVSDLPTVDNSLSALEALLQEQSTKAPDQTPRNHSSTDSSTDDQAQKTDSATTDTPNDEVNSSFTEEGQASANEGAEVEATKEEVDALEENIQAALPLVLTNRVHHDVVYLQG